MIAATVISQASILCAGFYTTLPEGLSWARWLSPFFYTFGSVLKTVYRWSDTYECMRGRSSVGPNQCFLGTSSLFDTYRKRGIVVSVFGRSTSSNERYLYFVPLLCYFLVLQVVIYLCLWLRTRKGDAESVNQRLESSEEESVCGDDEKRDERGSDAMGPSSSFSDDMGDIEEDNV